VLAVLLAACAGDASSERGRGAGSPSPSVTGGDGAGNGPAEGALDAGAGPFGGFSNADAELPMFSIPDGGFPDAATTAYGDDPDDDSCGTIELESMVNAEVEGGNLLVVFDNSGSMGGLWNDTTLWEAAGNALRDAVSSLSEYLTVAAIIFPRGSGGCVVPSIDSDDQIRFLPGSTFLAAWDNFMATNAPGGGTPLPGALMAADQALSSSTLSGTTRVVVLTDGVPSCTGTALDSLPAAWLMQGIQTHVVGLPGSESAAATLDLIAAAGGTTAHLRPDDSRTLRRQFAGIISESVTSALSSCTIPVDPAAPNVDDVQVVVTQDGERQVAERDLGEGGGWRIDDEGTEIEFFGAFCDKGLAGDYDRISIELGCVDDLPRLDPPVLD
jgi:hypothetical protein